MIIQHLCAKAQRANPSDSVSLLQCNYVWNKAGLRAHYYKNLVPELRTLIVVVKVVVAFKVWKGRFLLAEMINPFSSERRIFQNHLKMVSQLLDFDLTDEMACLGQGRKKKKSLFNFWARKGLKMRERRESTMLRGTTLWLGTGGDVALGKPHPEGTVFHPFNTKSCSSPSLFSLDHPSQERCLCFRTPRKWDDRKGLEEKELSNQSAVTHGFHERSLWRRQGPMCWYWITCGMQRLLISCLCGSSEKSKFAWEFASVMKDTQKKRHSRAFIVWPSESLLLTQSGPIKGLSECGQITCHVLQDPYMTPLMPLSVEEEEASDKAKFKPESNPILWALLAPDRTFNLRQGPSFVQHPPSCQQLTFFRHHHHHHQHEAQRRANEEVKEEKEEKPFLLLMAREYQENDNYQGERIEPRRSRKAPFLLLPHSPLTITDGWQTQLWQRVLSNCSPTASKAPITHNPRAASVPDVFPIHNSNNSSSTAEGDGKKTFNLSIFDLTMIWHLFPPQSFFFFPFYNTHLVCEDQVIVATCQANMFSSFNLVFKQDDIIFHPAKPWRLFFPPFTHSIRNTVFYILF